MVQQTDMKIDDVHMLPKTQWIVRAGTADLGFLAQIGPQQIDRARDAGSSASVHPQDADGRGFGFAGFQRIDLDIDACRAGLAREII